MGGTVAIQRPTTLPGIAPYAAIVVLQPASNEYFVSLWETSKPMGINQFKPNQLTKANGTVRHLTSLRVQSPIATWEVGWAQPVSISQRQHPVPILAFAQFFVKPIESGIRVQLPKGMVGMLYSHGTDPAGTVGNTIGSSL